jgi:hypothetical protein
MDIPTQTSVVTTRKLPLQFIVNDILGTSNVDLWFRALCQLSVSVRWFTVYLISLTARNWRRLSRK